MADNNKLFLGTNKDTYIAADDAGNVVIQTEHGTRAVIDTEGVKVGIDGADPESLGGGGVQGTGTTNRVPKFTDETTIGNSDIFINGSTVNLSTPLDGDPSELLLTNYNQINAGETMSKIKFLYGYESNFSISTKAGQFLASYPDLVIEGGDNEQYKKEFMRISTANGAVKMGEGSFDLGGNYVEIWGNNGEIRSDQFDPNADRPNISILSPTKQVMEFVHLTDFSTVGNISIDATSTSYNTASDYRLKEDFQPISNSLDKLDTLKPINFAWKNGGKRVDGFLAHEVAEVIPEAVTGEKDGTEEYTIKEEIKDKDGNIIQEGETGVRNAYQAIDQSKIVPLLTAALQEANQLIKDLTARVEALENK